MKKRLYILILLTIVSMMPLLVSKTEAEAKYIYTTSSKVNAAAYKIIEKVSKEGMSQKEKLHSVYMYLVKHMKYSYATGKQKFKVTSEDMQDMNECKKEQKKEGKVSVSNKFKNRYANVLTMQGTCYGMSKVLCILANQLGFKANMVHGKYVTSGGRRNDHYWCYIVVDGKKKYCDLQIANYYYKKHHTLSWAKKFYCRSAKDYAWRKHHRS